MRPAEALVNVEICVIHLAWAPIGLGDLERFIASYAAHDAGVDHRLVVAWKGFDAGALVTAQRIVSGVSDDQLDVDPEPLDLSSYREAAERTEADLVCFLNSSSIILSDGWLRAMTDNLSRPGVGLVGATGSFESPLSGAPLPLRVWRTGRYPAFPNPHVRTNAFMLSRALMLELRWPSIKRKEQAWELECGIQSVTRQIEKRGLAPLVVGRDGYGYPRERWFDSRTFRSGGQENLMVADNRTRQYAEAPPRLRRKLERLAWGEPSALKLNAQASSA